MLEEKINFLLSKRDDILNRITVIYNRNLALYGKQDFGVGLYVEMLLALLALSFLGYNQKLELHKRLVSILRQNSIVYRIPVPDKQEMLAFYYGVGAPGLDESGVLGLTANNSIFNLEYKVNYSTNSEVMYFAYPAPKGNLISIIEESGFETINAWTRRLMDLDAEGTGTLYPYIVYESNNLVTISNYLITFKL